MKEELEGKEAGEEVCRSAAEVCHSGLVCARTRGCAKEWVNDY